MADTLRQGSKGDSVTQLQTKLGRLGFDIKADGIFGPNTDSAIKELQTAFGYDVDGVVGSGTHSLIDSQVGHNWNVTEASAIKRALEAQGKTTEKGSLAGADLGGTLKKGASGPAVRYLQRRLASLGFSIKPSGTFDDQTEKTVQQFQESFGYTVDGIVGEGTHKLINAQIGYGWSAHKKADSPEKAAEKQATATLQDKKAPPKKGGGKG